MKTRILLCGMDVHDKSIVTQTALGESAPGLRKWRNTGDGRKALIRHLEGRGASRIVCVYEASGAGFGLFDELRETGIECSVLAPTRLRRSEKERKAKTDAKDALRLLQVLRNHVFAGDDLPAVWVPDLETRDDRELVRSRLDMGKKVSACKAQVRSLLKRNGLEKPAEIGAVWTKGYKNWLLDLGYGRREGLRPGACAALLSLLRTLKFYEDEEARQERLIAILTEEDRYRGSSRALQAMPGVGLLTAMVFLTEMGDLRRFRNRRKVAAYLGVIPCAFESGEGDDRKGHITRQGPGRVRKVLNQCAWSRIRIEGKAKRGYESIVLRNPKKKKIALVAMMRRLAIEMWQVARHAS